MCEWVSVKERLPEVQEGKEYASVLVCGIAYRGRTKKRVGKGMYIPGYMADLTKGRWYHCVAFDGRQIMTVTHWAPLPKAAEGD